MNLAKTIPVFTLCVLLCSCSRSARVAYQDEKVKVLRKGTVNLMNVHASAFGETCEDVRGQAPFYLEIPGKDSILFVTGRTYDNGQATVHVLNYKTRQEISFPAYDSQIGANIVSAAKANDQRFEKVESIDGDKLVIAAGFLDRRFRYFIDLNVPEFEKEEAIYPQRSLGLTNRYVIPHGRLSEGRGGPILTQP
jgi:hypothetical protein